MSEGKKNLKNLRDRLGVNKDAAAPTPAVAPPGVTLPPVGGPPGLDLPPAPPVVNLPVGLELPPPPQQAQPAPPPVSQPAPVYVPEPPKPVVIKGNIDDETANLAGLNNYATIKKGLMVVVPVVIFGWVGHIIGNMITEGSVTSRQKEETSELWKKVRNQDEAIAKMEKAVEVQINQKMKKINPDSVAKDAKDFYASINPKDFFPDDGLFFATTPLIDNGKKDTDPRFLGQTLEYIDATSQFIVKARLQSITTERDKANLGVGFERILTRIKELSPATEGQPEPDPMVKEVVGGLAALTQAPLKGYGIELLDGNKGRLVIIKDIEKDADGKNKSYTVYDAKYGAAGPTDQKEIKTIEDKTKVAVIDRRNARTFLLNRDTLAVENFFTNVFYLKGASTNMRRSREEAAQSLENALKSPSALEAMPEKPATPTPAPAGAAPEGDAPGGDAPAPAGGAPAPAGGAPAPAGPK